MNQDKLDQAIRCADFFINEAATAFDEMTELMCEPVSDEQIMRFQSARNRFWLNANRARKEHGRL